MSDVNMVSRDKFDKYIITALKDMRVEKDFCDVTLVCGNGHQLLAHKLILSAYSPFFHNLLKRNPHPHPLIYMRGASYTDVQAVLDYMYMGEANVATKNIDSFVILAKDLQIKGLEKQYNSPNEDLFDVGRNHQEPPQVPPKKIPLGGSSKKNPSQDISTEKPTQTSFKQKLPQVKSAKAFSPRSSSNEEPSHRSTKQPGPQEQTQQKSVGTKRSSSSSVSPPSKSMRTGTSFIQDVNESSESKTASGIKQGTSSPVGPDTEVRKVHPVIQDILDTPRDNESDCSIVSAPGSTIPSTGSIHTDEYGEATDEIRRFKTFKDENIEITKDNLLCKICNKLFEKGRKYNAERHLYVHFGSDNLPCQDCGLFFKNAISLESHKRQFCTMATKDKDSD